MVKWTGTGCRLSIGNATAAIGLPFRDDNSHEDTKGHELHVASDPNPNLIKFPGMVEHWERFWSEIPKSEFEVK